MEKTITMFGTPYFILESEESGLFYLVESISYEENEPKEWMFNFAKNEIGECIELRKGLDIIETPNRNVSILVKRISNNNLGPYVINELKKHAEI